MISQFVVLIPFNGLHGVIPQKRVLFITTAVRTSNPTNCYFIMIPNCHMKPTNSAVGIGTGYGQDDRRVGVRVPVGSKMFSSPRPTGRFWGPPSLLSNGYWGLSPGVKRTGLEDDQPPPTSAGVKNTWICTSTALHVFMA
jgi:hypothetical protein